MTSRPPPQPVPEPPTWLQIRARILDLCPQWDAAELGGFRYLEGGYSNRNFRFRHGADEYVLRLPGKPTAFTDREIEATFYQLADGLPVPEVVAFERASGHMVTRWVGGHLLADRTPAPDQLVRHLRALHTHLAQLRATADGRLERRYDPLAQARRFLDVAPAPGRIHALAERLTWQVDAPVLCHNDLNPWNLIEVASDRWITLDWEWVGLNDPLFDLVALHQGLAQDDDQLATLAAALLGHAVEPTRLYVCRVVYWLREYGWAHAECAAGSTRTEIIAQRDLGLRRLDALAATAP